MICVFQGQPELLGLSAGGKWGTQVSEINNIYLPKLLFNFGFYFLGCCVVECACRQNCESIKMISYFFTKWKIIVCFFKGLWNRSDFIAR